MFISPFLQIRKTILRQIYHVWYTIIAFWAIMFTFDKENINERNLFTMKKRNILSIILCILVVFLIIVVAVVGFFVVKKMKIEGAKETTGVISAGLIIDENATDKTKENQQTDPLSERMVYFAGIEDCTINQQSIVYLENLPENEDFLMKYQIFEGEKLIYETDLIPSGMHIEWKAAEDLSIGEHKLDFKEVPYYPVDGNYIELTSGVNAVVITVTE